jgi:5-methylcytosine-specific restriction enzyme subunit McrC
MQIPIENIYYLLCYAWNKLDEADRVQVSAKDQARLLDLFARVLINGTRILLKRGIDKAYVNESIEVPGVKGKIEISETYKSGLYLKQRTICSVDEFSIDIITNQILLTTLRTLLKAPELAESHKADVVSLIRMMPDIQTLELSHKLFKQVRIHRNNRFYSFLINVCQLIYENSLPTEKPGEWQFADFTRDERKMASLFEAFLYNFYRIEYPSWSVGKPHIKWQLESVNDADSEYLPRMETDITIENDQEVIIIDAKYYRESLAGQHGSKKIQTGNLYQLFSCLLNQRDGSSKRQRTRGILIYPTVSHSLDLRYNFEQHPIEIRTVDLNTGWIQIEDQLRKIVRF